MRNKHLILKLAACALALTLLVGLAAVAAGAGTSAGTSSDPLVTLSYVDETFRASLLSEVDQRIDAAQGEYTAQLNTMLSSFSSRINTPAASTPASSSYRTVTLAEGQTQTLTAGQQFLVLSGTGTVGANAIVDVSDGKSLSPGAALSENHLYTAPAATSFTATVGMSILLR